MGKTDSDLLKREESELAHSEDKQTKAERPEISPVQAAKEAVVPHTGDNPEIHRIQAEIAVARMKLASSVEKLKDEVRESLDWKGYVRENPWKVVGAAFAAGFFIGSG